MNMMHRMTLVSALLIACSACSRSEQSSSENASDVPDVALTTAPGTAFRYDYRFGLDAAKIARVQEAHAAACESLGADRCRITGLTFHRQGKDDVTGTLEVALAPPLARAFGKKAIGTVETAQGTVSSIEIAGIDLVPANERSTAAAGAAQAHLATLEAELAKPPGSAPDREALLAQIAEQQRIEREAAGETIAIKASLASTPVRFVYSSDESLPGINPGRTAWGAVAFAGMLLNAMLAIVVVLAVLMVPAGLVVLAIAHGRRLALRLWRRIGPKPESAPDF